MALTPGTSIGSYEITAQIGVGGMGEVYRATDTKLKRQVAIKVLPEALAGDAERLARFQREAEVLASLNHPNIAAIHGLEDAQGTASADEGSGVRRPLRALIMELVEGPTLADRIAQGPVPVDEALPIAKQIAEALEAAHEQGIIHRDLKPANVKVRPDGTVKVLDFGLAKAMEPAGAMSPSLSQSPTITTPAMTQAGLILGTAAYMSPEQARGKPVDRRADIWAFGCVLYELLTGRRPFDGDDVSVILADVIRAEPDWTRIPTDLSPSLAAFLKRCLRKDPKDRVRDIGDVRLALEGAFGGEGGPGAALPSPAQGWRLAIPYVLVALVAGVLGAGVLSWTSGTGQQAVPSPIVRFPLILPPARALTGVNDRMLAVSPTGTRIAYVADRRLYVRDLDAGQTRPLEGTEDTDAATPVFSPDGAWVAFFSARRGQLLRAPVEGGAPTLIADIDPPFGMEWGSSDEIVFASARQGIFRVPTGGGELELLVPNESDGDEQFHGPQILPNGDLLFTVASSNWDRGEIVVQSLDSGDRRVVVEGGTDGRYVPTGHLLYVRAGTVLAAPFDLGTLETTGNAVPVVNSIDRAARSGAGQFDVSSDGVLAYVPGGVNVARRLVWRDRLGRVEPIDAPPRNYVQARIAPDARKAVLEVQDEQADLWIWDFERTTPTRLVGDPANDTNPEWSVDGEYVYFLSDRNDTFGVYRVKADGAGQVEAVVEHSRRLQPNAFTADGSRLVVAEALAGGPPEFSAVVLEGEPHVEEFFHPGYLLDDAHFSPNGRFFVYESGANYAGGGGGAADIFVRPYPELESRRWPISVNGGHSPMWGPSGREIFYFESGTSNRLMRVEVTTEPTFSAGRPELMFQVDEWVDARDREYDIDPDGSRFLMMSALDGPRESLPGLQRIEVVLNWHQELQRLVPTD